MSFEFGSSSPAKSKPRGLIAKSLAPDPLADVEYTGNVEADSLAELNALEGGWRQRRDAEEARFRSATDSEFWFAVCFKDRGAKDAFLAAIKAARLGDKYIDGHALARLLGVELGGG